MVSAGKKEGSGVVGVRAGVRVGVRVRVGKVAGCGVESPPASRACALA